MIVVTSVLTSGGHNEKLDYRVRVNLKGRMCWYLKIRSYERDSFATLTSNLTKEKVDIKLITIVKRQCLRSLLKIMVILTRMKSLLILEDFYERLDCDNWRVLYSLKIL